MNVQEEILTAIKEYQTIIIHRHQRPDPARLLIRNAGDFG